MGEPLKPSSQDIYAARFTGELNTARENFNNAHPLSSAEGIVDPPSNFIVGGIEYASGDYAYRELMIQAFPELARRN